MVELALELKRWGEKGHLIFPLKFIGAVPRFEWNKKLCKDMGIYSPHIDIKRWFLYMALHGSRCYAFNSALITKTLIAC
jgi:hypothetical protein